MVKHISTSLKQHSIPLYLINLKGNTEEGIVNSELKCTLCNTLEKLLRSLTEDFLQRKFLIERDFR